MDYGRPHTHLVVIDDDDDIRLLVCTMLEGTQWSIATCSDAATALDCVRKERPDVILLDLRLNSTRSGWDILRELRDDPSTAVVPVILFTADRRALQENEGRMKDLTVGVLCKPFELDELYQALDAAVQQAADEVHSE